MTECSNEVEIEWIKATVQALDALQKGGMSWVTALSNKPKGTLQYVCSLSHPKRFIRPRGRTTRLGK